jgi:hypothetical protein
MDGGPNDLSRTREVEILHEKDSRDVVELGETIPSTNEELLEEEEAESTYPKGLKLVTLTIALMLSTFMAALDTNVVGKRISTQLTHQLSKYALIPVPSLI